MAQIKLNGCNYYYEVHGSANKALVFSHGLLWSAHMFHKQVEHFKKHFTVITYDHRGQGKSQVTDGGYHMDQLYSDAVALLEHLDLGVVHFGGLSMGGFIGLRLAARRPDLIQSLILMETSAQDEPNKMKYGLLNTIVKLFGVQSVTKPVMNIMFGDTFLNDPNRKEEVEYWKNQLQKNRKTIVRAVTGVIHRAAVESELDHIRCPTLILVGTEDIATTPEKAEFMHSRIPNSTLKYIKNGGHTGCIEEPDQYNKEIDEFLKMHS